MQGKPLKGSEEESSGNQSEQEGGEPVENHPGRRPDRILPPVSGLPRHLA